MNLLKSQILIVDDDISSLILLTRILESSGYRVEGSNSGEDALEKVKQKTPDLILLDILMPGMDGYETCKRLKLNKDLVGVPVIFITAANNTSEMVKGFEAGAVDFISKPINKAEIQARVSTHLELKHSRDQIADVNKGLLLEIENRKQAEEKFKALSETAFEAVLFLRDSAIIETNKAARELFGLQENKTAFPLISEFVDSVGEKILSKISRRNDHGPWEVKFFRNDGTKFFGQVQHQPIQYKGEMINVLAVRDITRQKEHDREVLNAILETQENERKRFSRDLHDGLGAILSALKIYAGLLQKERRTPAEKNDLLNEMKTAINQAVETTRNIANDLMPSLLIDHGLIKALKSFGDALNKTGSIHFEFKYPDTLKINDNNKETHLYRIILELANNTLKYADARNIYISFSLKDNNLIVDYKDDGKGFDFKKAYGEKVTGQGLKNISSRINFLNGRGNYLTDKEGFLHFCMEIPL
ncbi:MAG: response regulator [Bacteroidales bacterium]|nr:response regulator [Bacteroidales bacterium]